MTWQGLTMSGPSGCCLAPARNSYGYYFFLSLKHNEKDLWFPNVNLLIISVLN
jgi:hypothetical protein